MIQCIKLVLGFCLIANLCVLCLPAQSAAPEKFALQEKFVFPIQETAQTKSVSLKAPSPSELPQILADFEQYAVQAMADWEIPGMAYAIVQNDEVIYAKGFGARELGKPDPVTTDTVFPIGSASKAFTSLLMAMMVEEGHFSWNDPVISLLPDFRMYDPWVTREFQVRDLMSQHSGMPGHAALMVPFFHFDRDSIRFLERFIKPVTSFRADFAYQNTLFLDAAALLEKVSGKTWEQLLQERIFTPLGMTRTTATWDGLLSFSNRTLGHRWVNGWTWGDIIPAQEDWPYNDWVYHYGPAGSLACSILDLAKWARFQLNKGELDGLRLIAEDNLEYTHRPHTIMNAPISGSQMYYAQGWCYQTYDPYPIVWHNGGTLTGTSMVSYLPEAGLGFVSVANLFVCTIGDALHLAFYDRYFRKENPPDWCRSMLESLRLDSESQTPPIRPQNPAPSPDFQSVTGHYANSFYGTVSVRGSENGDSLILSIGPQQQPLLLTPWDGNVFLTSLPECFDYADFTTFHLGADGASLSMSVDLLNTDAGFGEFTRVKEVDEELPWLPNTTVSQLDALIEKHMQQLNIPGAVVGVWTADQGKYLAARGFANLETGEMRTLEDPFRIGSITKTFTVTVALQLIQEGLLDYTTPLSQFYPDFPNAEIITIRDLMRMKAGIPEYTTDEFLMHLFYHLLDSYPIDALLAPLYERVAEFGSPGEKVSYCNTNMILLESIVEKVTGNSLAEEIAKRITEPLGLQQTFYPTGVTFPGRTRGYDADPESGQWIDHTEMSPDFSGGSGAMISNLYDLKTFAKALYEGTLLSPETQTSRLQAESFFGQPGWFRYGEGIVDLAGFWGHSGSIFGFQTIMCYYPPKDATIVISYNTEEFVQPLFLEITALLFPNDVPWAVTDPTNVANWRKFSQ
jgi:CubicO group peptidase (beta-lactamase class C family)